MDRQGVRKSLTDIQGVRKSFGLQTMVDITLVMDATGSMQNLMDNVKANALELHAKIKEALKDKNRLADKIRVKIIAFRDVYEDQTPFIESDFFVLRENGDGDEVLFRQFVSSIEAIGGGDEPESALEALHMAINADYAESYQGQKARHIIVLMTDASAHKLDDPRRDLCSNYPQGVPADLPGLQAEWESKMDIRARRLVVFAPNAYPWSAISTWMDVQYVPSPAGVGIDSQHFSEVLRFIAGSI